MSARQMLWIALAFVAVAVFAGAQETQKVIKHVPMKHTSAASGQEMYTTYCAVCHGKDAKGTGPAADALKKAPADLTQITRRAGATSFPEVHVMRIIKGDDLVGAHGSRDMPIWGELFKSMRGKETAELRVNALMRYLESIQAK